MLYGLDRVGVQIKVTYQDQPFAWEAREYLRKMVVGKQVLGHVVHQANNRCVGRLENYPVLV